MTSAHTRLRGGGITLTAVLLALILPFFPAARYNHWFDGMALMHQFRVAEGSVTYRSKFLQSDSYRVNSQHNRIVVSEFGTLAMPDPCKSIFGRFMARFELPGKG